jgi:hypothetical protein
MCPKAYRVILPFGIIVIYNMEFGLASDRTNNVYFDRAVQMGIETSIS